MSSTSTCVFQHEASSSLTRTYIFANTYVHLCQHVRTSLPTRTYIFANTYIRLFRLVLIELLLSGKNQNSSNNPPEVSINKPFQILCSKSKSPLVKECWFSGRRFRVFKQPQPVFLGLLEECIADDIVHLSEHDSTFANSVSSV